jgi:hypothetical protein
MTKLIGLMGAAGSGKDTVADILVKHHRWAKITLADPMKRACAEWFNWDAETLWGPSSARNEPHARLKGLSARRALQTLGTEFGRACYPDVWVDYAMRVVDALLTPDHMGFTARYTARRGLCGYLLPSEQHAGVVISDVRFPNEVAAIRAKGGIIWKTTHGEGLIGVLGQHESERHIDSLEVDAEIPDGSLDTLPTIIESLLKFKGFEEVK